MIPEESSSDRLDQLGVSTSAPATEIRDATTKKYDQVSHRYFHKLALLVHEARSTTVSEVSNRTDKWFNLVTPNLSACSKYTKENHSFSPPYLAQSLQLNILLCTSDIPPSQNLAYQPTNTASYLPVEPLPKYILLERWEMAFHPRSREDSSSVHFDANGYEFVKTEVTPQHLHKQGVSLFRSVFTLLRVLPAWSLAKSLLVRAGDDGRPGRTEIEVRFGEDDLKGVWGCDESCVPQTLISDLPREAWKSESIEHPHGSLDVSVEYMTFPNFKVVSREFILSSQLRITSMLHENDGPAQAISIRHANDIADSRYDQESNRASVWDYLSTKHDSKRHLASSPLPVIKRDDVIQPQTYFPCGNPGRGNAPIMLNISELVEAPESFLELQANEIVDTTGESYMIQLLTTWLSLESPPDISMAECNIQAVLDYIQVILDHSLFGIFPFQRQPATDKDIARRLRRILQIISMKSELLPRSLYIQLDSPPDQLSQYGGGYADIYEGKYNGKRAALKRMRVFKMMSPLERRRLKTRLHYEALIWVNLSHDHVLPLWGVNDELVTEECCIVMPWLNKGNILNRLESFDADNELYSLRQRKVHQWIIEILLGLAYLHEERIVHGDLRGANILIDDDDKVRLADFGLAVFADGNSNDYASTRGSSCR